MSKIANYLKHPGIRKRAQELSPEESLRAAAALRTAFIARFIVLREGRRSRAHRAIEELEWSSQTTAAELAKMIRQTFIANGDKLGPVDRDIRRALDHAECSARYFIDQYAGRSTLSFKQALLDYQRSNQLLFGDAGEPVPRKGGWRLMTELHQLVDGAELHPELRG